jgi:hypothetical protein
MPSPVGRFEERGDLRLIDPGRGDADPDLVGVN